MTIDHFKPGAPVKAPGQTNWRYSELNLKTSKLKGRLFDHIPNAKDSPYDFEQVFSSFSPDKKFRPPVSSKDIL